MWKLGEQVSPARVPTWGDGLLEPCAPAHRASGGGPAETRGEGRLETQIPIPEPESSPGSPFFTPEARQHPSLRGEPSSDWLHLPAGLCVGLPSLTAKVVTTVSLHVTVTPVDRGGCCGESRSHPRALGTARSFQHPLFPLSVSPSRPPHCGCFSVTSMRNAGPKLKSELCVRSCALRLWNLGPRVTSFSDPTDI